MSPKTTTTTTTTAQHGFIQAVVYAIILYMFFTHSRTITTSTISSTTNSNNTIMIDPQHHHQVQESNNMSITTGSLFDRSFFKYELESLDKVLIEFDNQVHFFGDRLKENGKRKHHTIIAQKTFRDQGYSFRLEIWNMETLESKAVIEENLEEANILKNEIDQLSKNEIESANQLRTMESDVFKLKQENSTLLLERSISFSQTLSNVSYLERELETKRKLFSQKSQDEIKSRKDQLSNYHTNLLNKKEKLEKSCRSYRDKDEFFKRKIHDESDLLQQEYKHLESNIGKLDLEILELEDLLLKKKSMRSKFTTDKIAVSKKIQSIENLYTLRLNDIKTHVEECYQKYADLKKEEVNLNQTVELLQAQEIKVLDIEDAIKTKIVEIHTNLQIGSNVLEKLEKEKGNVYGSSTTEESPEILTILSEIKSQEALIEAVKQNSSALIANYNNIGLLSTKLVCRECELKRAINSRNYDNAMKYSEEIKDIKNLLETPGVDKIQLKNEAMKSLELMKVEISKLQLAHEMLLRQESNENEARLKNILKMNEGYKSYLELIERNNNNNEDEEEGSFIHSIKNILRYELSVLQDEIEILSPISSSSFAEEEDTHTEEEEEEEEEDNQHQLLL